MEQFSLEKYLENLSRKIVTRRGNPVRIICIDRKHGEDELPIVFLEEIFNGEFLLACRKDGRSDTYDTPYDLFFADEEGELTKFEKAVQNILNEPHFQDIEAVKQFSNNLLNLARKELEKSIENDAMEFAKSYTEDVNPSFEKVKESEELWKWKMSCLRGINKAYTQGKQDALKDLPKLEKSKACVDPTIPVMYTNAASMKTYVEYNGYTLCINDAFEKLPKEE